jgi:hypothetical protein
MLVGLGRGLANAGVVLVVAVGACRTPRPCAAVASAGTRPAPPRDYCLAPPGAIERTRPESGVAGWSAAVCSDSPGTGAYFIHEGTKTLAGDDLLAIHKAVIPHIGARTTSGIGGCCSPAVAAKTRVACIKIWIGPCELSMSQLVSVVDRALSDAQLSDARLGVDLSVMGMVGPRCQPSEPDCGPLESGHARGAPARPTAGCQPGRVPLDGPVGQPSGNKCAHDGECVIDGCDDRCVPWHKTQGGMVMCDAAHREDDGEPEYCGCVEERCAWFRPAAH